MVDALSTDNCWDIPAAVIILIVSAVAASFPTLAKRAPRIQPPEITFFITKHFGTGVILATAFVHLLQEAFESLNHPSVSGIWKELTGFIVYESPHAHHHKVAARLVERQHIPVLYVPEPANGEDPVCINVEILQDHDHESVDQQDISRKTRIISILVLQLGIMVHSVVIGLTLSITEGAGFSESLPDRQNCFPNNLPLATLLTAIVFHQLFEGLSLGIRISTLPDGPGKYRLLPVILCGLFAITAPLGLLLGAVVFPSPPGLSVIPQQYSQVKNNAFLIRGLMCALSAGMLMYASAVEMLAGDFVMSSEMRQLSLGKQIIALGSLILGTCAMAVIGVWL
ncbi:hypothetical protein Clacol_008490 [Clathrus columnatus]|uniref:Uncharacterized protein n=1 Tax=Clathrus columnatus TaxID=1419009 RepID=A0AAV5AME2_9AGAM|nr:hypothetical protein Clacol_008490 [Clathrus columnatus]